MKNKTQNKKTHVLLVAGLITSLLINLVFIKIFFTYLHSPVLDFAILKTTVPRFCEFIVAKDPKILRDDENEVTLWFGNLCRLPKEFTSIPDMNWVEIVVASIFPKQVTGFR